MLHLNVPQMDADDELKLAPVDETEQERKKRLLAETFQLTQSILQEKDVPDGAMSISSSPSMDEDELTNTVVRYLRQMADGDLDSAQRTAEAIAAHRGQSKEILDQIACSDPPDPRLQNIPAQVLSGLIRNLRTRIS